MGLFGNLGLGHGPVQGLEDAVLATNRAGEAPDGVVVVGTALDDVLGVLGNALLPGGLLEGPSSGAGVQPPAHLHRRGGADQEVSNVTTKNRATLMGGIQTTIDDALWISKTASRRFAIGAEVATPGAVQGQRGPGGADLESCREAGTATRYEERVGLHRHPGKLLSRHFLLFGGGNEQGAGNGNKVGSCGAGSEVMDRLSNTVLRVQSAAPDARCAGQPCWFRSSGR